MTSSFNMAHGRGYHDLVQSDTQSASGAAVLPPAPESISMQPVTGTIELLRKSPVVFDW